MGLRRLFGFGRAGGGGESAGDGAGAGAGDVEPPEIDAVITTVDAQPGQWLRGEVAFRGGGTGLKVDRFDVRVMAKYMTWQGISREDEVARLSPVGYETSAEVAPGAEHRIGFGGRLPWECPITELGGRSTGVDLSVVTTVESGGADVVRDIDFLHVAAPPLHEAVMDAFFAEGYHRVEAELIGDSVPYVEQRRPYLQTYYLEDSGRKADDLAQVEATVLNSQVGALVFVRRGDRDRIGWNEKPPALSFPVAHHELGEADLGSRIREALADLPGLDRLRR
ncbi:sporulation protein [Streptomyces sp. G1]|uniref:sporulation protein n=1 Tax=Streptomyces sp. G1 TaxID=361572 RepID=UPI00202EA1F8|nr:sporulation protein [Streptomyces sp. G1]MCM1969037.1 sporulation protein [Streptomyces sp. G1]